MSVLLEIRGLKMVAGGRELLSLKRLNLERGGSYLLSGDNGAGKTTLLRVIAGLESATAERFAFDGVSVSLAKYPRRLRNRIAFVHDHPFVFATSVSENVGYGLRALSVAPGEAHSRVTQALEWAGIAHLAHTRAQSLSAGEKQRLALARVHVLDPLLYLLDEPTANLDEDGRRRVIELIEAIASEGRTLMIACHDRELLSLPGFTQLTLAEGRLTADQT